MHWKSEGLALVFGMLVIFIIFGDAVGVPVQIREGFLSQVGNLDTAFGLAYWRLVDIVVPVASVLVFLMYGRLKGGIRINLQTGLVFFTFLTALVLVILDDFFEAAGHHITLSLTYWACARWFYFAVSMITFLAFGAICAKQQNRNSRHRINR